MSNIISNVVHGNYVTVKIETENGFQLIEVDGIQDSVVGLNPLRVSSLTMEQYAELNPTAVDSMTVAWVESQRNLYDSLFSNL